MKVTIYIYTCRNQEGKTMWFSSHHDLNYGPKYKQYQYEIEIPEHPEE